MLFYQKASSGSGGGSGSSTLAGDSDVAITDPSDGQALNYNATSGKWENGTIHSATRIATVTSGDGLNNTVNVLYVGTSDTDTGVHCYCSPLPTIGATVLVQLTDSGTPEVTGMLLGTFSPTQVPHLAAWLDAADASTLTLSGSQITAWADKSGNGHNASLFEGLPGPTEVTAALNGLAVARFGASSTRNGLHLPNLASSASFTQIVVINPSSSANAVWLEGTNDAGNLQIGNSGQELYLYSGAELNTGSTPALTPGTAAVITALYGSSAVIRVNGAQKAAGSTGENTQLAPVIGAGIDAAASAHAVGDLAELLVFDRVLTSTELSVVETYLKDKWGTP